MEPKLKKIDPEVCRYIENEILPKYRGLKGHTDAHIADVIRRSLIIAKDFDDVNLDMVYVIAAYHDLGRLIDNETHNLESAKMIRNDEALKDFFTPEEVIVMSEAVEDHRASLGHEPRSIYGKIVSCADRSTNIAEPLGRAYDYEKSLHPDWSEEEVIEQVRIHLREKYSHGGYAVKTMYFKNPEFEDFVEKIEKVTATQDIFYRVQTEFNKQRLEPRRLIIFGASKKGYEMALKKFSDRYQVIKIDPDALSEVEEEHLAYIISRVPIMVFGPVGSNIIPVRTEIYVTESRWIDSRLSNFMPVKLEKPSLAGAPCFGVPCYTSDKFVTETGIKAPVVFDRVLAYLIQEGFNVVSSWRIVSDNLSKEQFERFKNN